MADFSLRGVSDLQQRLVTISRDTRESLSDATLYEAEQIVQRAKALVPVETGNLRDTIHVVKGHLSQGRNVIGQFTEGSAIEVVVTAGNESTPQAVAIHEHPSPHDPPSWHGVDVKFSPGAGPKYLERPLLDAVPSMAERVGSKVGTRL